MQPSLLFALLALLLFGAGIALGEAAHQVAIVAGWAS